MTRPLSQNEAKALAELDRLFAAEMAAEATRMDAEGIPTAIQRVIRTENERRFAEKRVEYAVWAAAGVMVH